MTNIMLVEDHPSFRQALAFLLDREDGFGVVGQAGTLAEARRLLKAKGGVDLAVVDLQLPDGSGAEFVKDLRQLEPEVVVLVLTAGIEPGAKGSALEAGADEVLFKSAGATDIVEAAKRLIKKAG